MRSRKPRFPPLAGDTPVLASRIEPLRRFLRHLLALRCRGSTRAKLSARRRWNAVANGQYLEAPDFLTFGAPDRTRHDADPRRHPRARVRAGLLDPQRQRARVTAIDPNSAEWQAAVSRAQSTLPLLRELFPAHPQQTLVKVAVATASGSREHVWAELRELGPETLSATIVTPLLDSPSAKEKGLEVPVAELEDWHVLLPDGRIRGSFTTQAQIQVCRATGQPIPRELRGIEDRLVDVS
jgi:hypothetical protein